PGASVQRERSAGACRGTADLAGCIAEGYAAGEAAARAAREAGNRTRTEGRNRPRTEQEARHGKPEATVAETREAQRGRAFVDFQNDVTTKDIRVALREGFRSIEHVKRYTTSGMATDQGKTSNMNALGVVAGALQKAVPEVGHTTFRMPYTPVT